MKTMEELTRDLESLTSSVSTMKKDFELKLTAAKTDATEWKSLAEKKEKEAKEFREKAEKAEQEKAQAFQENRIKETKTFLDEAVKSARITPATKVLAEKLMESMTSDAVIHTFEAKDGSKTSHTQLSLFREFINSLQKSKVFSSLTPTPKKQSAPSPINNEGEDHELKFMEVKKEGVMQNLVVDDYDLGLKAVEYQNEMRKIGKNVDYAEALIAVSKVQQVQE